MTIIELQIMFDLDKKRKIDILKKYAKKINLGFFLIDSDDGQCYLFDGYGNLDDVLKVGAIDEDCIPKDIVNIVIPNGVTCIKAWTFYDCNRLENIVIPNSVMRIGEGAFYNCHGLTSMTIPNSVIDIRDEAFDGCSNLKSLIFERKTIDEAKSMKNYPFGIEDESIIKCIK